MVANVDEVRVPPPQARGIYPWGRFWAKWIDLYTVGLVAGLSYPKIVTDLGTIGMIAAGAVVYPFCEGLLIALFGTTPGKATFNISVTNEDGGKLTLPAALRRSYESWLHGAWLGIPIAFIIAMWNAYKEYGMGQVMRWDKSAGAVFVARRPSWYSWVGLVVVGAVYALFLALGASAAEGL